MKRTSRKQKGVVAIEFAIGFFAFWLMVAAWVEISYMAYVGSMGDLAVAHASRVAKKEAYADEDTETYLKSFSSVIKESGSIWQHVIDTSKISVSVQYLDTLNDLLDVKECVIPSDESSAECGTSANKSLAIYTIDYRYNSIFSYFSKFDGVMSREVIVVQEYERDEFDL